MLDDAGDLLHFFAGQLDVTRRREAKALAQQGQRMDALGSVATGVAHELSNMMTIVRGGLEQARANPSIERQAQQLARAE